MEQTHSQRNAELHPKCQYILKAGPRKGNPCNKCSMPHNPEYCAKHDPTGRLKLSKKVLEQLRAGVIPLPHIGGEGECPVERGHIRWITPRISIVVDRVIVQRGPVQPVGRAGRFGARKSQQSWRINYSLYDTRQNVRSLRRVGVDDFDIDEARAAFSPENFEWDRLPVLKNSLTSDDYTSRATGVIDDAGEAPPPAFMNELLTGAVDSRLAKRAAAMEKACETERELIELAEDPDTTNREKKHIKEIRHHIKQLRGLQRPEAA